MECLKRPVCHLIMVADGWAKGTRENFQGHLQNPNTIFSHNEPTFFCTNNNDSRWLDLYLVFLGHV